MRGEWRAWVLAPIAALSVLNPDFVLRWGAVVSGALLLTRFLSIRVDRVNVLVVALTGWAVVSQLWASAPAVTGLAIQNQIAVGLIFLAVRTSARTKRALRIVAWGYLTGCLCAVYIMFRENPSTAFVPEVSNRYGIDGLNINYLAYALTTGLVVALLLWVSTDRRGAKLVIVLAMAAILAAVSFSGTRGAYIAIAALALFVFLHRMSPKWVLRFAGITIAVIAFSIVTGLADSALTAVDASGERATGDLAGRLTVWPAGREVWGEHFLVGVGAGGFRAVSPLEIGAHNVILEVGTGMGLIGVIMFVAAYVAGLSSAIRRMPTPQGYLIVGAFVVTTAPFYLSGHWELSAAGWVVFALVSNIDSLGGHSGRDEIARHDVSRLVGARHT